MDKEDLTIWAIFYGGLVSIQFHPRNANAQVNLDALATVADEMLERYKVRKQRSDPTWLPG